MKKPLFVSLLAVTGGVLIGSFCLGVVIGGLYVREKPWNDTAIKARYVEGTVYESDAGTTDMSGGEQPEPTLQRGSLSYSTNLVYELTNTTSRDYTLAVPSDSMIPMKLHAGTLISAPELRWYELPIANFPAREPVFIPSHKTVRVLFSFGSVYLSDSVKSKAPHEVVSDVLGDGDSFVILDGPQHYRIELPLREFKNAK